MQTSGPVQQLAAEIGEVLGRAEQDLEEIEAALRDPHPAPARLGSFVRGELSPVENRALVRHLLIGCSDCSAVLRPLFRCHERAVS